MRRVVAAALIVLGGFLLGTAVLLRFFVADQLVVTPIDQYAQTVAPGPGAWFDSGALQQRTSDLVATRTVKADVKASSDDTAVWDVSVNLSTGDGTFVRASVDRVAVDRKTGEAVACCGEAVDSTPTRHAGLSYKFPFDTQKQDYQLWDVNSRQTYPAKYVTEEKVQGLTTYKFIQTIPGFELRTQDVPGSVVGESAATFQAPVWYSNTRTVWVEPRTGIIVKGNEQNRTTLRNSAGEDKVTVVQFDLTFDDGTQQRQADLARDGITQIRVVTLWLPLLCLVLGVIFVIAGVVVGRSGGGGGRRRAGRADPDPEPAA